jgi:anti-anti-sigma factor
MTRARPPITFTDEAPVHVVEVGGEQDLASAPALVDALQRAAEAHPGCQIRVDLHAVTFMDCAGMRPLLQARNCLGDRLCLWGPSCAVTQVLRLTNWTPSS